MVFQIIHYDWHWIATCMRELAANVIEYPNLRGVSIYPML